MDDIEIDGAQLWFPSEIRLVETIRFIDRRYLGVITTRSGTEIFYASLMRKSSPEEKDTPVMWTPYTLCEAMTNSVSHGREIVLNAYEALSDRLATNS